MSARASKAAGASQETSQAAPAASRKTTSRSAHFADINLSYVLPIALMAESSQYTLSLCEAALQHKGSLQWLSACGIGMLTACCCYMHLSGLV